VWICAERSVDNELKVEVDTRERERRRRMKPKKGMDDVLCLTGKSEYFNNLKKHFPNMGPLAGIVSLRKKGKKGDIIRTGCWLLSAFLVRKVKYKEWMLKTRHVALCFTFHGMSFLY